ncbi:MAG: leucine-rich repeat protein [Clostridia bacterium]|nr:leucine-rich repeat protein [Clostridia bacterium]
MKGKMKGFLSLLGTLTFVIGLAPVAVFAGTPETVTDGVVLFKVSGSECIAISRDDSKFGLSYTMPPEVDGYTVTGIANECFKSSGGLQNIVLPETLENIGERAFQNSTLEGVTFQSDVTLGKQAFEGCNIISLDLSQVTVIGEAAFSKNTNLSQIVFSKNTELIKKNAFNGCTQLTYIYSSENKSKPALPSGLASKSAVTIGESAFQDCTSLKNFSMEFLNGGSTISFGKYCFKGCTDLTELVYPDNLFTAGVGAFMDCTKLKKVTVGSGCQSIEDETFCNCIGLEKVTYKGAPTSDVSVLLPDNFTRVGSKAFMGTAISSIQLPSELNTLGAMAFKDCTQLGSLNIPKNIQVINDGFCQGCTSLKVVSIPALTQSIKENAFSGCTSLQYFNIASGSKLDTIGDYAFSGCSSLSSFSMPDTVINLGKGVYQNCNKLAAVDMSTKIFSVQDDTFKNCSSLTSIAIGNDATYIGTDAFSGCTNLKEVKMPDDNASLATIGASAFSGCTSLKSLRVPEGIKIVPKNMVLNCSSLTTLTLPSTVTTINDSAFEGCSSLSSLKVPDKVTVVPVKMCYKCTGLIAVNLPVGIETVADNAFAECSSLTTVTNIDKATVIGSRVFQKCTSLKSLKLGSDINVVPDYLCSGCTSLKNFDFTYILRIGQNSFEMCGFETLKLGNNIVNIESGAFANCAELVSVTLPKNSDFSTVKENVFSGCKKLSDCTIPANVTDFGTNAFKGCAAITLPFNTAPELASGVTASNHPFCNAGAVYVPFKSTGYDEGGWVNSLCSKKSNIFYPGEITLNLTDFKAVDATAYKLTYSEYTLNLAVDGKHSFPDSVSVTYTSNGNSVMSYVSYDKSTGTITIDTSKLNGQITITAVAVLKPSNNNNNNKPTPTPVTVNREEVEAFVTRCYSKVFERDPDQGGLDYWTNLVVDGKLCGAQLSYGFFFSEEFANKNTTNEQYVEILYNVFLNRASDAAGKTAWVNDLNNGKSREEVYYGFANSSEFDNLCREYGIPTGFYVLGGAPDQQKNVNAFVARLYRLCLSRLPDQGSQAQYVMDLMAGRQTGANVGYMFVFSNEYLGNNPSDSDFVKMLYNVFMGREPDEAGFNSWVEQLGNGADKMDIFRGFVYSPEYSNICAEYGIVRGDI